MHRLNTLGSLLRLSCLIAATGVCHTAHAGTPAPRYSAPPPAATAAPAAVPRLAAAAAGDAAAPVAAIDRFRHAVEDALETLERRTLMLENARAQVRQKWDHMHAYLRDGEVVRIKLYPHAGISERSEEFYYRDGRVVLVFVEDRGASIRGRDAARRGKTYYFADGRLIREVNESGETEITDQAADAARLLQEAQEYLALASR